MDQWSPQGLPRHNHRLSNKSRAMVIGSLHNNHRLSIFTSNKRRALLIGSLHQNKSFKAHQHQIIFRIDYKQLKINFLTKKVLVTFAFVPLTIFFVVFWKKQRARKFLILATTCRDFLSDKLSDKFPVVESFKQN